MRSIPLLLVALLAAPVAFAQETPPAEGADLDGDIRGLVELNGAERGQEVPRYWVERDDEPVSGLRLRVYREGLVGGYPLGEAVTDRWGRAILPALDGACVIVAEGPSGALSLGPLVYSSAWRLVDLSRRAPHDTLPSSLRVVSVDGRALEGARVRLHVGALQVATATADAAGRIRFDLPAAGSFALELTAEAPGHLPLRLTPGSLGRASTLRLLPGTPGAVAGRVLTASGLALPGALVRAVREGEPPAFAAADREGRFELAPLPPGRVTLEVFTGGEQPEAVGDARVVGGQTATVELTAQGRAPLRVRVRDANGPVVGARVEVVDPGVTRFGVDVSSGVEQRGATDADGVARFDLAPGRYYVRAWHPAASLSRAIAAEARRGEVGEAVIDLAETRPLAIKVVTPDGEPVPGVFMDVSMPGFQWRDMPARSTSGDGVARFGALPPGRAELHLGRGGQWRMVVVTEGEAATFVWTENAPLRVEGRVQGGGSELLAAVVLADVVRTSRVRLDGEGSLNTRLHAPGGAREVFLVAPDPALAPLRLGQAPAGEEGALRDLDLRFARGGTLTGRLIDARGNGVPARARIEGPLGGVVEARTQWLTQTANDVWITVNEWPQAAGPDGRFALEGLPPGVHRLRIEGVGCVTRLVEVEVVARETTDLGEVRLEDEE